MLVVYYLEFCVDITGGTEIGRNDPYADNVLRKTLFHFTMYLFLPSWMYLTWSPLAVVIAFIMAHGNLLMFLSRVKDPVYEL